MIIADVHLRGSPRQKILDDNVGGGGELLHKALAGACLHVHSDGPWAFSDSLRVTHAARNTEQEKRKQLHVPLVPVDRQEIRALFRAALSLDKGRPPQPRVVAGFWNLDLQLQASIDRKRGAITHVTLTTSAPQSPNSMLHNGPASTRDRSSTLMPRNAEGAAQPVILMQCRGAVA